MSIVGIVAISENYAIGMNGKLPWHYPEDLNFFREITINNAVVMGYTTWKSIGKPLPKRLNIVLSRSAHAESHPNLIFLRSTTELESLAKYLNSDLYVIGGAETYRTLERLIEKWVVTEIPETVEGDVFMQRDFLQKFKVEHSRNLEGLSVKFYELAESLPVALHDQLMLLPTNQLLQKFGAGNHVPGSGSAAALSGIIACKLCLAVIKFTEERDEYSNIFPRLRYLKQKIYDLEPKLYTAFQQDSEVFDKVITARRIRDAETNTRIRKRLSSQALEKLRDATQIPLDICEVCHEVCESALQLFDTAFQSARGDSGAAVSSALSGAYSSLFICYLNLKQFRTGKWSQDTRERCEILMTRTFQIQRDLFSRVISLRDEGIPMDSLQLQFDFDFDSDL